MTTRTPTAPLKICTGTAVQGIRGTITHPSTSDTRISRSGKMLYVGKQCKVVAIRDTEHSVRFELQTLDGHVLGNHELVTDALDWADAYNIEHTGDK